MPTALYGAKGWPASMQAALFNNRKKRKGVGWLPTALPDLLAWFDFSDPGTLWKESTRTTPVSADGDPVGFVAPKGGESRSDIANNGYSQSTGGSRPAWNADGFVSLTSTLELNGPSSAQIPLNGAPWTLAGLARYDELPGTNDPLIRMAANVELRGNTSGAQLTLGAGVALTVTTAAAGPFEVGEWLAFVLTYGRRSSVNPANVRGRLWVNGSWYDTSDGFEFTTNETASTRKPELVHSTKQRSFKDLVLIRRDVSQSRDLGLLQAYLQQRRDAAA